MRVAGIREVKNQLSAFLRLVRQGETVLISDRGKVVAQLSPPPAYPTSPYEGEVEALHRLARAGILRVGSGEPASVHEPPVELPEGAIDLDAVLDETRSDRGLG